MAEGETQYNIPVSSKQLIVYFVFLVIALSAAFLAGVMVGRNVDSSPEPTVRDIQDDRVPDEPVASPTPDALTYGSALQSDKVVGLSPSPGLSASSPRPGRAALPSQTPTVKPTPVPKPSQSPKPSPVATPGKAPTPRQVATERTTPSASTPARATPQTAPSSTPSPQEKATPRPTPSPKATPKPSPSVKASKPTPSPISRLTLQVGAFKERAAAEAIVKRLKGKGYSAYLVPVSEGLFNVRVGSFTDREDAERVLAKLETQEKFKPFIVKP